MQVNSNSITSKKPSLTAPRHRCPPQELPVLTSSFDVLALVLTVQFDLAYFASLCVRAGEPRRAFCQLQQRRTWGVLPVRPGAGNHSV